jgi:hypothetical protein
LTEEVSMAKTHHQFVRFVKQHLAEYGMRLIIGRGKYVNTGHGRCEGYFNEIEKIIRIGGNNQYFLQTLVHEYAHFLQYINQVQVYTKSDKAGLIVENWFKGREYDKKTLKRAFLLVRAMERDCEKRALKLIDEFNLKIDKKLYAKRANCYIYTHFLMEKTRKYGTYRKSPYFSKYVLKIMPSNMAVLSHRSIPPKIYSILESFTL